MEQKSRGLFTRGKRGNYYARFYVDGREIVKALRDEDGRPIRDIRKAKAARRDLMAELGIGLKSKKRLLENIADKLTTTEERLAEVDARREAERRERNRLSIGGTWDAYLASPKRPQSTDATLRQYGYQWQAFADWVAKECSDIVALADVTPELAETYATHLSNHGGLSAGTYNKHIALLKLVFRILGPGEGLSENPFAGIEPKRARQNHRKELALPKLAEVCDAATGEMKLLLFLGIYTGLRLKDCALLTWEEIDLARGLIIHTPFKTARFRSDPLHIPIHPSLRAMLERTPPDQWTGYLLPNTAADYKRRSNTVTSRIQRLFTRCGIQVVKPGTGGDTGKRAVLQYGFHSLRHTAVTLLREAGAAAAAVQAIVGHTSRAITDKYTHVSEESLRDAIAGMPTMNARKALPGSNPEEADARAKLAELARTLPIERVRAILDRERQES